MCNAKRVHNKYSLIDVPWNQIQSESKQKKNLLQMKYRDDNNKNTPYVRDILFQKNKYIKVRISNTCLNINVIIDI